MYLLRPNFYISVFLQMDQVLEANVRCLGFTLRMNTLYKFYIRHIVAQKM
jgi:hypothetical protein